MEITYKIKYNLIAVCIVKLVCTMIPSILFVGFELIMLFMFGFVNMLMSIGGMGSDFSEMFGVYICILNLMVFVHFIVLVKAFITSCMENYKKMRSSIICNFAEEFVCIALSCYGAVRIGVTDDVFGIFQLLFLVSAVISLILNIRNIILVNKLVYLEN